MGITPTPHSDSQEAENATPSFFETPIESQHIQYASNDLNSI